ncbi:MAG: DUF6314 family protein [Tateyamaria sp.]|uniref:DUF6314 family protein n=1 Tax=Tateyamaria sp. TaxID=1929288 RepID=UPI00328A69B3
MSIERCLADFIGAWDIARKIVPAHGPSAEFAGQGVWTPTATGAEYAETGVLTMPGATPMTAERRYVWGQDLSVYFDDGRFFHRVPACGGTATHFCDPDTYGVEYDFEGWPTFTVSYAVHGPRKDYVMRSTYCRAQ